MEDSLKNKIQNNLHFLCENTTSLSVLLNKLLQQKVLTVYDTQIIESKKTSYDKNRELFLIAATKGNATFSKLTEALEESGNECIAEKLSDSTSSSNCLWFECGTPTTYFTGRDSEMELLRNFERNNELIFLAITGLGGVGKSELAKNFAREFYNENMGHVIWINAEKNISLFESFQRLSKKLGISVFGTNGVIKSLEEMADSVYNSLSKMDTRCLIIFDNIEGYGQHFLASIVTVWDTLPPKIKRPFILMTSRFTLLRKHLGQLSKQIDLAMLSKESAQELVRRALEVEYSADIPTEGIEILCDRLGNYPLALQQAIAYINQKSVSMTLKLQMEIFLESIQSESKDLLQFSLPRVQTQGASQTTYLTWKVTLKKITEIDHVGEIAINTMNIISLLSPDNITSEILSKLLSTSGLGLETLSNYSMCRLVQETRDVMVVQVHRLVQEVVRFDLEERRKLTQLIDDLLTIISGLLVGQKAPMQELIHYEFIWMHGAADKSLAGKHENLADEISRNYCDHGRFRELIAFSNDALKVLSNNGELENQWTWKLKYWSTVGDIRLGNFEEAEKNLLEIRENQLRLLGDAHDDFLLTQNQIGWLYFLKGTFPKSLQWTAEVLKASERVGKMDHPTTLDTKEIVGLTLKVTGKYNEALTIYREILESRERVLGAGHPDIFVTKYNIANVFTVLGNYGEANTLYREALLGQEKLLGKDHPYALLTRHNLAAALNSQRKYDEAIKMHREVLEAREKLLGSDNPDTLVTKNCIALALCNLGQHDAAIKMYEKILEAQERVLGNQHHVYLETRHNMAFTLSKKRKFDEAAKIQIEILELREKLIGKEHPRTLSTKTNLATTLNGQQKYEEAMKMYAEVLNAQEIMFGEDHPHPLMTKHTISVALSTQQKYTEAAALFKEVLAAQEKLLGEDHPDTLTTKHNLAHTVSNLRQHQEAIVMFKEVLEIQVKVLGEDHRDSLRTKQSIAVTLKKEGRNAGAEEMFTELLTLQEKVLGADHSDTLSTKHELAETLTNLRKYDEAVKLYTEVLKVREEVLGINHTDTLSTKKNLEQCKKSCAVM